MWAALLLLLVLLLLLPGASQRGLRAGWVVREAAPPPLPQLLLHQRLAAPARAVRQGAWALLLDRGHRGRRCQLLLLRPAAARLLPGAWVLQPQRAVRVKGAAGGEELPRPRHAAAEGIPRGMCSATAAVVPLAAVCRGAAQATTGGQ